MSDAPGGLGRIHMPDPRDHRFPMAAALAEAPLPPYKYWPLFGSPLDQGDTSQCVGHAWKHFLLAAPIRQGRADRDPTAATIYREAQERDEWPGTDYDGTSVRGGAKALQERGMVGIYSWAYDAETVARYVLTRGTVTLGTNWYEGMDEPDADGFARVGGRVRGGHAYLALGYSRARGAFRCLNSWGLSYGQRGLFWVAGEDMTRLLSEDGEACTATELRVRA